MQKITPNLWFDTQAEEAVQFYISLFKDAKTGGITRYGEAGHEFHQKPEGTVMTVAFELAGQSFLALNGGPTFRFNPSISFFVTIGHEAELDALWSRLSEGGAVLMPYQAYDWSAKYGWLSDKYGLSWQLSLGQAEQTIATSFLFVGQQYGNAEAAVRHYTTVFKGSSITGIMHAPNDPKAVQHAQFTLDGQTFMAMDSDLDHDFGFNEAVSLIVNCETQDEVDYYWSNLSEGGEEGPCGWLKDKFGVSWQVVPTALNDMLTDSDSTRVERVLQAVFGMNKLDLAALERAYAQG